MQSMSKETKSMIVDLARKVRGRWLLSDLKVTDLEVPEGCPLLGCGDEYLLFLLHAGVLDDNDDQYFRFWKLAEIRTTSEALGEVDEPGSLAVDSLIIADHLQESWWYGLGVAGRLKGRVFLVPGSIVDPPPVSWTLVEFLEAYLSDDESLYQSN